VREAGAQGAEFILPISNTAAGVLLLENSG
jgi:hypothetical protein